MCYCSTQQKLIDKKQLVNWNCQHSLTNTCINDVSVSSSNNSSLLNTTPVEFSPSPQSSSTPPNPLVAAGIIPATVYNSIIPAQKEEKQRKPRLNTQARLITSDEQIGQFEEKCLNIRKEKEEKEHRKKKENIKGRTISSCSPK